MTINISGTLNVGTGTDIVVSSGSAATFVVGGTINLGNNTNSNAGMQAGGTINTGTNAVVTGNLTAGGTVNIGNNGIVNGNVTGGGGVNVGTNGAVNGSCTPSNARCLGTPIGEWRMDEASWSGTANEVKDSSGNGNHGTAAIANGSTPRPTTASGSPAYSSGGANTCSYGQFDSTSGTIRTYTYVALSNMPALPSSFTFAAWIRSTNASQSGQRILVRDDNDNGWGFSLGDPGQAKVRFFNRNITNSGSVSGDGSNPSCGVFCLDTAAVITNNNWFFVAVAINTAAKTVTHYVYNQSGTRLSHTSSAYSGTWQDGTGTAAIGGETSASGEGVQSSFHFNGNIDEMQIYSGALTQTQIQSLMTRVRTCQSSGPNHVELVHDGSALTCTPKAVTVLGCTGSASCYGNTANQTADTFPIALNPIGGATWCLDSTCATPLPSPAAVSNGQVIYLKDTNVRTDRMSGTASSATNTAVQCYNTSSSSLGATTACDLAFSASGFLVSLPNHVSCTSSTLTIQAVKSGPPAGSCTPAFTGSRSETISFGYSNPTSGTLVPSVAGTAISTGGTAVSLTFDATGTASPSFSYADVGRLSITVTDSPLGMTGSTSTLPVIVPASFTFSGITAGPIGANNAFAATITAKNNCVTPTATPNFGKETTAESVTLSLGSRVAPTGANDCTNGPCNGTVTGGVTLPWSTGTATASNLSYSEVGDMTLNAVLTSGSYLGSGLTASGTSATIGAFVPAYFDTAVTQGCGTFTYSGQPFTVAVTAKSATGSTTVNYSNLTGCVVCSKLVTLQDPTATANFNGTNTLAAAAFAKGIGSSTAVAYTWPSVTTAPAAITLRAVDSSVTPNVTSNVSTATYPTHVEGSTTIRSGRLHMFNAYGSELLSLRVPLRVEYYTGSGWALNTADACTTIPTAAVAIGSRIPPTLGSSVSSIQTMSPGLWNIILAKPASVGGAYLTLDLGSGTAATTNVCLNSWSNGPNATTAPSPTLTYLAGQWCSSPALSSPVASAKFGSPKTPYIYMRERH
jgi:MSHA biogenesis protein MshQ